MGVGCDEVQASQLLAFGDGHHGLDGWVDCVH